MQKVAFNMFFILSMQAVCSLSQVYGPYYWAFSSGVVQSILSDDGVFMVIGKVDQIEILRNNGTNFTEFQRLSLNYTLTKVELSGNGKILLAGTENQLNVYERKENQYFTETQTLMLNSSRGNPVISKYGSYVALIEDQTTIMIFEKISGIYTTIQTITGRRIEDLSATDDFGYLGFSSGPQLTIYKKSRNILNLHQNLTMDFNVTQFNLEDTNFLINGQTDMKVYQKAGRYYQESQTIIPIGQITNSQMQKNAQKLVYSKSTKVHILERNNQTYQQIFEEELGSAIKSISIDEKGYFISVATLDNTVRLFYLCPSECSGCVFPTNCTQCNGGYVLNGIVCVQRPTNCVRNKYLFGTICETYCHKRCKTCNQTWTDCYECSENYVKDENGQCVIENEAVQVGRKVRMLLNVVRRRGFKFLFLVLDDLWLYNFHEHQYDGITKELLVNIKLFEESQWDFFALEKEQEKVQEIFSEPLKNYNVFGNPTYLIKERNNNVLYDSLQTYIVFYIPTVFVLVLILNKIFHLLFNYQISALLRPYSFWLILVELIVMNHVEFLTFLAFRTFLTPFSFDVGSKSIIASIIIVYFLVLLLSFTSYKFYYVRYKKLAKYFLVNLYRFPKSYILMTILYGMRPFLKGCTHALLYQNWELQLILLIVNDLATIGIIALFQYFLSCHRSKIVFAFEIIYHSSLVIFNLFLLCKYKYFPQLNQRFEHMLEVIIFVMLLVLGLRLITEILLVINFQSIRNIFCPIPKIAPSGSNLENDEEIKKEEKMEKGEEEKKSKKSEKNKKSEKSKKCEKNEKNENNEGEQKKEEKSQEKYQQMINMDYKQNSSQYMPQINKKKKIYQNKKRCGSYFNNKVSHQKKEKKQRPKFSIKVEDIEHQDDNPAQSQKNRLARKKPKSEKKKHQSKPKISHKKESLEKEERKTKSVERKKEKKLSKSSIMIKRQEKKGGNFRWQENHQ